MKRSPGSRCRAAGGVCYRSGIAAIEAETHLISRANYPAKVHLDAIKAEISTSINEATNATLRRLIGTQVVVMLTLVALAIF